MFNLLPEPEKKQILSEYSIRRTIIALAFLFIIGLVAVIAIFPAYVLSTSKVSEVSNAIESMRKSSIFQEEADLNSKLSEANAKLLALRPPKTEVDVATLFRSVISHKDNKIRLEGFQYTQGKGNASGKLSVVGISATRQDLSRFVDELKKDPLFKKVDLPVSSFTKDQNADFTLDITGNF